MLERLARRISSFLVCNKIIEENQKVIYDYCFEVLLSTILNLLMIVIISITTKTFCFTLCYMVGFLVTRGVAGGYHAETHWACFWMLMIVYAVYLIIMNQLYDVLCELTIIIYSISIFSILLLAPVDDHNRRLNDREIKNFKRKAIAEMIVTTLALKLMAENYADIKLIFSLMAGMCTVAISLIAGTIKNHIFKKTEVRWLENENIQ